MAELVAEVKTLMVHLKCDACGIGTMQADISRPTLLSNPPLYTHRCCKCGHIDVFRQQYPYTKFVPIEPLREPTEEEKGAYKNG